MNGERSSGGEVLIRAQGVSKKFCRTLKRSLWYGIKDIGAELTARSGDSAELRPGEFWALRDASFEVRRGDCLGLIGRNGAGKSTLLKLLNGLIKPDRGRIEMTGRVGSLIELGAGFNPVLTGRENVFVNAAVLGFSKRRVNEMFDEIVDFAGLADFIDAPVLSYSSGMKVRLGYAIASKLDPDILLIDEVLAVGDLNFTLKCFNSIERQRRRSAIILVSHNLPQIARTSTRALVLDSGMTVAYGPVSAGIDAYLGRVDRPEADFVHCGGLELKRFEIVGRAGGASGGGPVAVPYLGDLTMRVHLTVPAEYRAPILYLAVYDRQVGGVGECVQSGERALTNRGQAMEVVVTVPRINLSRGVYTVALAVKCSRTGKVLGRFQSVGSFRVEGDHPMWMPVHFDARFEQVQ